MTGTRTQDRRPPRHSTVATMLHIVVGPMLWALHLAVIYASQSALCARGITGPVVHVILGATALALAALLFAAVAPSRVAALLGAGDWPEPRQRFNDRVSAILAALSIFAVAAEGAAALIVSSCPPVR